MVRVEFDPKTLTFSIYTPTGISGCEVESYQVDLDNWELIHQFCHYDRTAEERIPLDSSEAEEILRELAKDVDYNGIEPALLAILAGSPIDEFFLDLRYIVNIDSRGKPELVAVELLPCMGDPSCDWIRIERSQGKVQDSFLDYLEELVMERLQRA